MSSWYRLVRMFEDTMQTVRDGGYQLDSEHVSIPGSPEAWREVRVFSAQEVTQLVEHPSYEAAYVPGGRCEVEVTDQDSFSAAQELADALSPGQIGAKPPLVLNFANPIEPGGGVLRGARAQEEDLCRRSTLYLALSSEAAEPYYQENQTAHAGLFAHNALLVPHVQVFRAADGSYLEEPFEVAVLTVAAPYVPYTTDVTSTELRATIKTRIMGMLQIAASCGYETLVLGAWGCGAFGNDPERVAVAFCDALHEMRVESRSDSAQEVDVNSLFDRVRFAVPGPSHNHEVFARMLADFHHDEDEKELAEIEATRAKREERLNRFQGCLVGGAVGDALGYPVEFMSYGSICDTFGPEGIRNYWLEKTDGTALFSDDTQMTLFTAAGLLESETRGRLRGVMTAPGIYIHRAYLDWLHTQDKWFDGNPNASWLVRVDELYARRAPGNTCLSALRSGLMGSMEVPLNDSKGCGGVMRVAPVGLWAQRWSDDPDPLKKVAVAAAQAAAVTHGHPMGYIPSGVLAALVALCAFDDSRSLSEAVELCAHEAPSWFEEQPRHAEDMAAQLRRAAELAAGDSPDHENVVKLGEGWCGDEALAIAVYCCLRHPDSFDEAVIAAVNHGGDSDSTGAIAGNIMGAYLGLEAIGEQWTADLELRDLILSMARDLCDGCLMSEYGNWIDRIWLVKYAGAGIGTLTIEDLIRGSEG